MKFIVSTSTLLEHLQLINGAVVNKPILPILENFLFDIKDGNLTITSTDLETSMTTTIKVDAQEDAIIAVPSKLTIETLRSLPEQPVTFTINDKDNGIEISSGFGRYKLTGQPGNDFPKTPVAETDRSITIPGKVLSKAVNKTLFATGNDELRLNLTGVFVQLSNDDITFVATDANRLVRMRRDDIKPGVEHSFILPKKALNLLKSALPADDTAVRIDYNQSNAFFTFGAIQLICRLIDERYPDYNSVIPKENPNVLTINRQEFLNSVKRISIFSNKTTHQIRLKIAGSELNISAEDFDLANEAQERLACQYEGEDLKSGLTPSSWLICWLHWIPTKCVLK